MSSMRWRRSRRPIISALHGGNPPRDWRHLAGCGRRLETVADGGRLAVVDDYAHLPTEIAASLATVRQMYPGRRVWCVFQPHQASRTAHLLDELATSLQNADKLVVAEIFRAREAAARPGEVRAADLARRAAGLGAAVVDAHTVDEISAALDRGLEGGRRGRHAGGWRHRKPCAWHRSADLKRSYAPVNRLRHTPGFIWADRPSILPSRAASRSWRRWCRRCRAEEMPIRLLGGGSNILVRDAGVPGVVLHLSSPAFSDIKVEGQTIAAGGGAKLGHIISTAVREGLAGLETLVGIPGHARRAPARQCRRPRRRHRSMDQPGHGDDPRRRNRQSASARSWCSPTGKARSTNW